MPVGVTYHSLPKDKDDLWPVMDAYMSSAIHDQALFRTKWALYSHYLRGNRHFHSFDIRSGQVKTNYLDSKGQIQYRHQMMLSRINLYRDRLLAMDFGPHVRRQGVALADIRLRSVAQAVADAVVTPAEIEKVKSPAIWRLLSHGCVGLSGELVSGHTDYLTSDIEVVTADQIFPYPLEAMHDNTKLRGKIRRRIVPFEWLKEKRPDANLEENLDKMDAWEVSYGRGSSTMFDNYFPANFNSHAKSSAKDPSNKLVERVVRIEEWWLEGHNNTVSRYIVRSGEHIIEDTSFDDRVAYCPLHMASAVDDGSFYGQGLADIMMPLNREIEKMLSRLFRNVRELDKFGVVLLPNGTVDPDTAFRDTGQGMKFALYDPDPFNEHLRPVVVQPATTGDFPGKVSAMGSELLDQVVPVSALLRGEAPGRVDSFPALSFLDKASEVQLAGPTKALSTLFGGVYRYLVASVAQRGVTTTLPISRLTEDSIGLVFSENEGTFGLSQNPIPAPGRLTFTIRDEKPRSELTRKTEAVNLFKDGLMTDPHRLIMLALKENLDFAIYMERERAAYRKTVMNLVVLFGDGKQPGELKQRDNTFAMVPDIQVAVVDSFIATPEFLAAEEPVQTAIIEYKRTLTEQLLPDVPPGLGNPDDEAAARLAASQPQEQGAPQFFAQG
jgi:hypothetical protein